MWETLGGIDKQNIESVHPVFNELICRCGNCRGRHQKGIVMRQFLFERASLVLESIDEMLSATSRKKRACTKKRGSNQGKAGGVAAEEDRLFQHGSPD